MERSQVVLDLIILRVLEPDIVVDTSGFLQRRQHGTRIPRFTLWTLKLYLLQKINQLRQRLIGPVLDLVPLEGAEILIHRLCMRR